MRLVLASQSASRRAMLTAAGVPFEAVAAGVDEDTAKAALAGEDLAARDLADALAELKALKVSQRDDAALVLGSDSVVALEDGTMLDKPIDRAQAATHLRLLSGKRHELVSAAVMAEQGRAVWRVVDRAKMYVRPLSDAYIEKYLDAEWPTIAQCVGCYRIEGPGAQLFTRIEGSQFTVLGLPLLPVLDYLRVRGVLASMTMIAEVIGDPIAHSKSPLIHGFWIDRLGIDAVYRAAHILPANLARYISAAASDGDWRGCNVTIPHKIAIMDLVGDPGDVRSSIGAMNTILRGADGALIGTNTDAAGFYAPIADLDLAGRPVTVIGAGGAARAVLFALSRIDVGPVTIINRNVPEGSGITVVVRPERQCAAAWRADPAGRAAGQCQCARYDRSATARDRPVAARGRCAGL